jgi:hypothetical protein
MEVISIVDIMPGRRELKPPGSKQKALRAVMNQALFHSDGDLVPAPKGVSVPSREV